jgi:hypothetical protein
MDTAIVLNHKNVMLPTKPAAVKTHNADLVTKFNSIGVNVCKDIVDTEILAF